MKSKFIGVDFDGTCVDHKYPLIGDPVDEAIEVIHELMEAGHKIILYTMRSGERLVQAVEYLEESGVVLFAVNNNPTQIAWTASPKIYCHVYIDDAALGCPLDEPKTPQGRPTVDWYEVRDILTEQGYLE